MPESPDLLITEPGKKVFLLLEKIISIENDPTTRGLDLVVVFHHILESSTPKMDFRGDYMISKLMENGNFDIVHFIMS